MRGIVNEPNLKVLVPFGFILPPLLYLCYTGEIGSALGLDSYLLFVLLVAMLVFSVLEIPVFRLKTRKPNYTGGEARLLGELYSVPVEEELSTGSPSVYNTKITLNIGGFVLPLLLAFYVVSLAPFLETLSVALIMILSTHFLSRLEAGVGIIVPSYVVLISIPFALILAPGNVGSVILVGGVLGILIGMMTLLYPIEEGSAFLNLGGVGSFEAIYITVLLAVILSFFG
ncbi:MAG: DUF1614 domain-containing protein [Methanosarcinales archaeon]|nr:MAG: DUF1614 domain-containing protein [Methanosarcinales archaeon]